LHERLKNQQQEDMHVLLLLVRVFVHHKIREGAEEKTKEQSVNVICGTRFI
jgi:hypothetical protein